MSRIKFLPRLLRSINCSVNRESVNDIFLLTSVQSKRRFCSKDVMLKSEAIKRGRSVLEPNEDVDLSDYGSMIWPSPTFAAYADKSPLLQELIKLGVNLHKIEQMPGVGEFILRLNFEKHVKPYLLFLHNNGVPADEFGTIITNHPLLLKEDLDDLQVRINYLESKKFTREMILEIIRRNPKWLSVPVSVIDGRLGYLQESFKLKGDQVRALVTGLPRLGTMKKYILTLLIFTLKEQLELEPHEVKKLILATPQIFKAEPGDLIQTYDYLLDVMKIPRDLILKQPIALTVRKHIFSQRHQFLQKLGRAQYNPRLAGYISLEALATTTDEEFCKTLVGVPEALFDEFLKTL